MSQLSLFHKTSVNAEKRRGSIKLETMLPPLLPQLSTKRRQSDGMDWGQTPIYTRQQFQDKITQSLVKSEV